MHRRLPFLLAGLVLSVSAAARADDFDWYVNKVLEKAPKAKGVKRVNKLTPQLLIAHGGVLEGTSATMIVVKTNDNRWAKLLVAPARQKISDDKSVPILLIEKFMTYKEGTDRAIQTQGDGIRLFGDFVFNLDFGQIVPDEVGGDIHFVAKGDNVYAEPAGKAEFYVVTERLPEAKPPKSVDPKIGKAFQPAYFTGVYKLYDDGYFSGELHLKVSDSGKVFGHFYSQQQGRKYPVSGKVGDPHHKIDFRITFPRTVQFFRGWMFTSDGSGITGYASMEKRQTGFYAKRMGGKKAK